MNNTVNNANPMPETLQDDLRQYGLERIVAAAGSAMLPQPQYFGMKQMGTQRAFDFTPDLQTLQDDAMNLAIVVPDNQTFDLMAAGNYGESLAAKGGKSVRKFLSDLLDVL